MYKSKSVIERKLKQVRFSYKRLMKRQGKVYVEGGLDSETGCYPADVDLGCFMALGRSIFQYAFKEIKEFDKANPGTPKQPLYDSHVSKTPIIGFFATLRNEDIHAGPSAHSVTITLHSPISKEKAADAEEQRPTKVEYNILKISDPSPELHAELTAAGEHKLLKQSQEGNPIYEVQVCEGEKELFKLCEKYMKEIETFVQYGISKAFIT